MSRTYRFFRNKYIPHWNTYDWKLWEDVKPGQDYVSYRFRPSYWSAPVLEGKIDPKSKQGKKILYLQTRDAVFRCKEPGPHWFRNLMSDRPLRRKIKIQLSKYILDQDIEVEYITKYKLDYWT